ncbi:FxSxx-COOH cyclophane-containing RiPP peptide [Streptomyces sp. NPDC005925]|uniref:FxSxx-COOH cyclophane-containing RiPP peptide n=1 Tax=Streptomyces sp. NPDC005925 TaxID=3157172 RepID=UPI0033CA562B
MGVRDESAHEQALTGEPALAGEPVLAGAAGPPARPLPDLLTLDLAELGSIDHPVLREVLGELRTRATEPSEMLWGFDNSF